MAFEQRDMSGSLFKNKDREHDRHPNATGRCMIDGVMYYVSAWTKKDKNGNPWQSLEFKRAQPTPAQPAPQQSAQTPPKRSIADMDDDIPF